MLVYDVFAHVAAYSTAVLAVGAAVRLDALEDMLRAHVQLDVFPRLGAVVAVRTLLHRVLVHLPVSAHSGERLVALAAHVARTLERLVVNIAHVLLEVAVCQVLGTAVLTGQFSAGVEVCPGTVTMEQVI